MLMRGEIRIAMLHFGVPSVSIASVNAPAVVLRKDPPVPHALPHLKTTTTGKPSWVSKKDSDIPFSITMEN